jgi:hypothetical protein
MNFKDLTKLAQETVCISLRDREDKREKFKRKWENILDFRWFITDKPTQETLSHFLKNFNGGDPGKFNETSLGRWGCFLSHYDIISSAKTRGLESILILEDDAYPNLDIIGKEINDPPPDWDVIYLGCSAHDTISIHPNVGLPCELTWQDPTALLNFHGWKRVKAWGTYAMILNKTAFDPFLREINDYTSLGSNYKHNVNEVRADGIYYFYIWKKMSFYLNENFVFHDDSFETDIPIV